MRLFHPNVAVISSAQVGKLIPQRRRIKSIDSNAISADVPLTEAVDYMYMTGQLVAYTPPRSTPSWVLRV
jgi:hypothetical protein